MASTLFKIVDTGSNAVIYDTVNHLQVLTSTDASSSTAGGALTVSGGLAVAKSAYVGTSMSVGGDLTVTGNISGTITGSLSSSSAISTTNTTDATSTSTGSITASGGLGVGKSVYVGKQLQIAPSTVTAAPPSATAGRVFGIAASTFTDSSTAASGTNTAFYDTYIGQTTLSATNTGVTTTTAATVYIAGAPIAGSNETLTRAYALSIGAGAINSGDTTNSTSASTGSIVVSGGIGVGSTQNSSGTTNGGALTVAGGAAFAKDVYCGGTLSTSSDARLKKLGPELEPFDTLDALNTIRCLRFQWNRDFEEVSDPEWNIGLVAQDVQATFPELVKIGSDGFLSVNYSSAVAVALASIKALNTKVQSLESKLASV
ncbi:uncharacterized protein BJ171DRAFT_616454 [Polychytrium aggregatum]|uniref:uncharacterized protein n=1 Tax=Polychytrium aggregatum TaxID=110093 RepID=UPI0022FDBEEB|nr:uncharacterized protein BJ171DRAFT_616454 [Polychytrium aggregatum]KAI9190609.1 hypothetical protein BJ171DRAFT_616454 [Polychytrium aggregatum]